MLTPLFSFGDWIASPNVQIGIVIVTFVATIVAFIIGKSVPTSLLSVQPPCSSPRV